MRVDQLATFRCVADERSYTRAAERLFMTQSAVYQQVRHLEQEAGVKLCYVLGKEVLLTAGGRAVYEFAVEVGAQHADLLKLLYQLQDSAAHVIRIGSAAYYGQLPVASERIAAKLPGTVVEFRSMRPPEAIEKIRAGEIDFGFFGLAFAPPDLTAEPWLEQRIVVAVSTNHELARRETPNFDEVAEYPFIGYISGRARAAVEAWNQAHPEIEFRYAALGDTSVGIRAMALSMHMPALVAEAAVQDQVQAGRMKVLRIEDFKPAYTLYIVHRGREHLSPAARTYLAELHDVGEYGDPDAVVADSDAKGPDTDARYPIAAAPALQPRPSSSP